MPVGPVKVICEVRAAFATLFPAGPEHKMIDDQLTAACEKISQRFFAVWTVERVLLVHFPPRQLAPMSTYFIAQARQFLLASQQILARDQPFRRRDDFGTIHFA